MIDQVRPGMKLLVEYVLRNYERFCYTQCTILTIAYALVIGKTFNALKPHQLLFAKHDPENSTIMFICHKKQ